ncbi:MAG: hypothetical protein ACJAX3_002373 [Patiriisocius sp.]
MVETAKNAIALFKETALDIIVLENLVLSKRAQTCDEEMLIHLTGFVKEIGISVIEEELDDSCFLPRLKIQENSIRIDEKRLKQLGDLLQEAGHL